MLNTDQPLIVGFKGKVLKIIKLNGKPHNDNKN